MPRIAITTSNSTSVNAAWRTVYRVPCTGTRSTVSGTRNCCSCSLLIVLGLPHHLLYGGHARQHLRDAVLPQGPHALRPSLCAQLVDALALENQGTHPVREGQQFEEPGAPLVSNAIAGLAAGRTHQRLGQLPRGQAQGGERLRRRLDGHAAVG